MSLLEAAKRFLAAEAALDARPFQEWQADEDGVWRYPVDDLLRNAVTAAHEALVAAVADAEAS